MATKTIAYTEKMVGAGHPVLSDTLNRLTLVGHNTDGSHKGYVEASQEGNLAATLAAVPTTTQIVITDSQTLVGGTVITHPIHIAPGGSITSASGILTFNGQFTAGAYQVFFGSGSVVFNGAVSNPNGWFYTGQPVTFNAPEFSATPTLISSNLTFGSNVVLTEVYPEWWGAVGDGVTDCTAAIQKALDSAANSTAIVPVKLCSGKYLVDELWLPVGTQFIGSGGQLEDLDKANTRLMQSNAGLDVIKFVPIQSGSLYYWHGKIADISIQGDTTNTLGSGIKTIDASGNNVNFSDQTHITNMCIRYMPEDGIQCTTGALPLTISNIKLLWNGGAGIRLTRVTVYQSIALNNISGDGNADGLIYMDGLSQNDSVAINNVKSEYRASNPYTAGTGDQPNAIVCNNCRITPIVVNGGSHISSVSTYAPGAMISITGQYEPRLTWNAVAVRFQSSETTNPTDACLVNNTLTGEKVSRLLTTGRYNTVHTFSYTTNLASITAGSGSTYNAAELPASTVDFGDFVLASLGVSLAGLAKSQGYVQSTTDTAVRLQNYTGGAIDLASTQVRFFVPTRDMFKCFGTTSITTGSITSGTTTSQNIQTCYAYGAALGDFACYAVGENDKSLLTTAYVSGADTVSVLFRNDSGSSQSHTAQIMNVGVFKESAFKLIQAYTYDPASIASNSSETTTYTLTGARLGDFVIAAFSKDLGGLIATAYVSAADTITLRLDNRTAAPIDLAAGYIRFGIINTGV